MCPCSLIITTLAPATFPARSPGDTGLRSFAIWPSLDLALRYFRTSSRANRLLTVERAANFMAVAFATISAWEVLPAVLNVGTIGVLTIEAQFPFPAL